jgi:hypothetical protein
MSHYNAGATQELSTGKTIPAAVICFPLATDTTVRALLVVAASIKAEGLRQISCKVVLRPLA